MILSSTRWSKINGDNHVWEKGAVDLDGESNDFILV